MKFNLFESFLWPLVLILFIIILILVFYLKILRSNIRRDDKKYKKYRDKIEKLLITFLYSSSGSESYTEEQQEIINQFKIGLLSKTKRKIITETFLELDQQVSGEMITQMNVLYRDIGLIDYALSKLNSNKWHIVAIGIKDLRQFKVKKAKNTISKLVNHEREEVRREAHLYFLELFGFSGLEFLDNLKAPLSEWDQILLLAEVENLLNHDITDVKHWLKSDNDFVILFVLTIVKAFNRLETKDYLLDLLHHKNIVVRIRAIEIITHFEVSEAKAILIEKYDKMLINEKRVFFKYLEKTADTNDSVFLINHINSDNFEIRHKALLILKQVNPNFYDKLEKESEDKEYNRIVQFLDQSYGF